jgi:hypothetical protein
MIIQPLTTFQGYSNIYINRELNSSKNEVTKAPEEKKAVAKPKSKTKKSEVEKAKDKDLSDEIIQTLDEVRQDIEEEFGDKDRVVKHIYLNGLHYIATENENYYVVPDKYQGYNEIPKKVTKEQIIKPFRTEAEWNKVGITFHNSKALPSSKEDIKHDVEVKFENMESKVAAKFLFKLSQELGVTLTNEQRTQLKDNPKEVFDHLIAKAIADNKNIDETTKKCGLG